MPSHKHSASSTATSLTGQAAIQSDIGLMSANPVTSGVFSKGQSRPNHVNGGGGGGTTDLKFSASIKPTNTISNTGGNKAHNVIQPYYVCNIWKRVS
jgi:microcystin-dependent protein